MWYNRPDFTPQSLSQPFVTGTAHILPGFIEELNEDIEKKRYTSEIYDRPNGRDLIGLVEGYMGTIFCASDDTNATKISQEVISLLNSLNSAIKSSPTYAKAFSEASNSISPTLCYLAMELLSVQEAIDVCAAIFDTTGKNPTVLQLMQRKLRFLQERDRASTLRMYSAANVLKGHNQ